MTKRQVMDSMSNFIEYYSSDDQERMKMQEVLLDYMLEVYEHPVQEVHFRRDGEFYWVVRQDYPTFKIHQDDREQYTQQFLKLKFEVHVG